MRYTCMCFGWYQELLSEVRVEDFAAAEINIQRLLDTGGMIVHAYRETDLQNPELVGRHSRLSSFMAANDREAAAAHEVERFLVDPAQCEAWVHAQLTDTLLQQRWRVVDLWCSDEPLAETDKPHIYGRAIRIAPTMIGAVDSSPLMTDSAPIDNQL